MPAGCSTCSKSSRASTRCRGDDRPRGGRRRICDSALAASNLNGHGTLFVTRDGDLVSPERIISRRQRHPLMETSPRLPPTSELPPSRRPSRLCRRRGRTCAVERRIDAASGNLSRGAQAFEAARSLRSAQAERTAAASARARSPRLNSVSPWLTPIAPTRNGASLEGRPASRRDPTRGWKNSPTAEAAGARALSAIRAEMAERRETRAEDSATAMLEAAAKVEARRARLSALEQELRHLRRLAVGTRGANRASTAATRAAWRRTRRYLVRELGKLADAGPRPRGAPDGTRALVTDAGRELRLGRKAP